MGARSAEALFEPAARNRRTGALDADGFADGDRRADDRRAVRAVVPLARAAVTIANAAEHASTRVFVFEDVVEAKRERRHERRQRQLRVRGVLRRLQTLVEVPPAEYTLPNTWLVPIEKFALAHAPGAGS